MPSPIALAHTLSTKQDAVHKARCLANLALRNGEAPLPLLEALEAAGLPAPTALRVPFMLVRVRGAAGAHAVACCVLQGESAGPG